MLDWSKRGEEGQSAPHSHINWEEEEEEEKAMEGGVGEAPPHNLLCAKKSMETGWWSEEEEQRSGASAIGARESFEARGREEGERVESKNRNTRRGTRESSGLVSALLVCKQFHVANL